VPPHGNAPATMPLLLKWSRQSHERLGNTRPQGHVRAPGIVMRDPLREDASQVAVRQGNQVIQAFPSQCANEPFTKGVCLRTSWWRFQHPQPEVVDRLVKLRGENAITVMDEEAIGMVRRDRFAQLLERPVCCGMRGHIGMEDPARRVFHDDKDLQEAKGRCHHHAEVTGNDRHSVITDKRPPALGGNSVPSTRVHALGHVLPHGSRRHPQAKLQ
jgi:hypothetical protein